LRYHQGPAQKVNGHPEAEGNRIIKKMKSNTNNNFLSCLKQFFQGYKDSKIQQAIQIKGENNLRYLKKITNKVLFQNNTNFDLKN
jgi:hypothetical protein